MISGNGTILNALRVALRIFSGKFIIIICGSETSADVSEPLFHGRGHSGERHLLQKEPLHVISCNGSFGMLLQIHHAADLGGGDGDGAQSGLVGIAAHRKDGAAPGGKVRVPCQRKGLPVLRHGAEAV